jgi:hypothetical protein
LLLFLESSAINDTINFLRINFLSDVLIIKLTFCLIECDPAQWARNILNDLVHGRLQKRNLMNVKNEEDARILCPWSVLYVRIAAEAGPVCVILALRNHYTTPRPPRAGPDSDDLAELQSGRVKVTRCMAAAGFCWLPGASLKNFCRDCLPFSFMLLHLSLTSSVSFFYLSSCFFVLLA